MLSATVMLGKVLLSPMTTMDFNLLPPLDALLAEQSVTRAAARMGVTVPSMSRTLARLRTTLGDPLLVRAGKELVPTAYAAELRARVEAVTSEAHALFAGGASAPLTDVKRTLRIRANDGATWTAPLLRVLRARAPHVTLSFLSEGDERPEDLRDGRVDVDLGVLGASAPELRTQVLLRDHVVGVVRRGHALARGRRTAARFAAFEHVGISRRGRFYGPIDDALRERGLTRKVVLTVATGSSAAVAVARSDWVATIPRMVARSLAEVLPLVCFELPFDVPPMTLSQTWHPRFDADPVHRLLREAIAEVARSFREKKR
jgi:DNA-binding transcriptional LysR family regulator